MEELDDVSAPVPKLVKRPRGPVELTMPKRPPCSGLDKGLTQTIHVYLKPKNRSLFLRIDYLDWLVAYAADEHHFQNVERVNQEPPQTAAVVDYTVEWDFNEHVWEGIIHAKPGVMQKTLRCDPEDLGRTVWGRLHDKDLVQSFYSKSTRISRKNAGKEYVKLWCAATVKGEGEEFYTTWATPRLCEQVVPFKKGVRAWRQSQRPQSRKPYSPQSRRPVSPQSRSPR